MANPELQRLLSRQRNKFEQETIVFNGSDFQEALPVEVTSESRQVAAFRSGWTSNPRFSSTGQGPGLVAGDGREVYLHARAAKHDAATRSTSSKATGICEANSPMAAIGESSMTAAGEEAREEAELKFKEEAEAAEQKVREDAEAKAKEEAEQKAQEEAAQQAQEEAEQKAREEAEARAKEETARKARKAWEEATQQAREEAEQKARELAEARAKLEAERKAREEATQQAREEAEQKAREEAEARAKEEAEKKAREEDAETNLEIVLDDWLRILEDSRTSAEVDDVASMPMEVMIVDWVAWIGSLFGPLLGPCAATRTSTVNAEDQMSKDAFALIRSRERQQAEKRDGQPGKTTSGRKEATLNLSAVPTPLGRSTVATPRRRHQQSAPSSASLAQAVDVSGADQEPCGSHDHMTSTPSTNLHMVCSTWTAV